MTDNNTDARDRGGLSPTDRDYLRSGGEGYSRQSSHAREKAIKSRIRNSLLDFELLIDEEVLGNNDLFDVLRGESDQIQPVLRWHESPTNTEEGEAVAEHQLMTEEPVMDDEIRQALVDLLVFVFRAVSDARAWRGSIEYATEEAFARYFPDATITANEYTLEYNHPDEAIQMAKIALEEGGHLTDAQVRLLLEQKDVDSDQVVEQVRAQAIKNADE